jgi:hypothetical protein
VVTFVGVLLYIAGVMSLVTSATYFLRRNDATLSAQTGLDSTALVVAAGMELIIAVLLFLVASGVMSGQKGARLFVAFVAGIRIVVAGYWLVASQANSLGWLVSIAIALFVLWALYGHAESERFFSGRPAAM